MTERLLHFLWQFQYFNQGDLQTVAGESLQVQFPGKYNSNQGPDFSDARIRIDGTVLAGTVELHIHASDWEKHRHGEDKNYQNVILHVVWENDHLQNGLPVLELKTRVSGILLQRYHELMATKGSIPCKKNISSVRYVEWNAWKDRLLAERLSRKTILVEEYLNENHFHWEETCWWLLARNFGIKINADAFETMARSIPVSVLAKYKEQVIQLEALLMGQAGLLSAKFNDDYACMLRKEYRFMARKYGLKPIRFPVHFLRMRPGNFPTIRLAQLSALIQRSSHLFSKVLETRKLDELEQCFDVSANDYWHEHYRFDELSPYKQKKLGTPMIENIVINTVIPLLFAYGQYQGEQQYKDRALQWLEQVDAEVNSITKEFVSAGIHCRSAFDSQALLELKNTYCTRKRCLECAVGNAILKMN